MMPFGLPLDFMLEPWMICYFWSYYAYLALEIMDYYRPPGLATCLTLTLDTYLNT